MNGFSFVNLALTGALGRAGSWVLLVQCLQLLNSCESHGSGFGFNPDSAFQPTKSALCVWADLSKQDWTGGS